MSTLLSLTERVFFMVSSTAIYAASGEDNVAYFWVIDHQDTAASEYVITPHESNFHSYRWEHNRNPSALIPLNQRYSSTLFEIWDQRLRALNVANDVSRGPSVLRRITVKKWAIFQRALTMSGQVMLTTHISHPTACLNSQVPSSSLSF